MAGSRQQTLIEEIQIRVPHVFQIDCTIFDGVREIRSAQPFALPARYEERINLQRLLRFILLADVHDE
ncbi:MAG: hypothetical protein JSV78_09570 [Phycisphaerales bacterium]|nr:MAG: hypothetical protein JSV78_09570 [Phycisphaerales bacterium]